MKVTPISILHKNGAIGSDFLGKVLNLVPNLVTWVRCQGKIWQVCGVSGRPTGTILRRRLIGVDGAEENNFSSESAKRPWVAVGSLRPKPSCAALPEVGGNGCDNHSDFRGISP